jgi:hypothetical protein
MPSYNFRECFAGQVERKTKRQTIRARRKSRPRPGQIAYCFAGLRTKRCRRLGAWPIRQVHNVRLFDEGVLVDGAALRDTELDAFARADGFGHWPGMLCFFSSEHGLPFQGDLVIW